MTAAIRLNPDDPSLYGIRGSAYEKKGEHDKAIDDLNRAISAYPTDIVILCLSRTRF